MTIGKRIDSYTLATVGVPFDLGWGTGVWNADHTVTRTCKGCGVSVTTPVDDRGEVVAAHIHHADGCPVITRLGNNQGLS